jgi:hypothetical protein
MDWKQAALVDNSEFTTKFDFGVPGVGGMAISFHLFQLLYLLKARPR